MEHLDMIPIASNYKGGWYNNIMGMRPFGESQTSMKGHLSLHDDRAGSTLLIPTLE